MRKTLFLFLVFLPMLYSLQDTECDSKENPKSKNDCNGLGVGDKYKCCYVKYSMKDDGSKETKEGCENIYQKLIMIG